MQLAWPLSCILNENNKMPVIERQMSVQHVDASKTKSAVHVRCAANDL